VVVTSSVELCANFPSGIQGHKHRVHVDLAESEVEHSPSETGLAIDKPGDQVDQGEQVGSDTDVHRVQDELVDSVASRLERVGPSTKVVYQRTADQDIASHAASQLDTTRDVIKLGVDSSDRVPDDEVGAEGETAHELGQRKKQDEGNYPNLLLADMPYTKGVEGLYQGREEVC